MKCVIAPLWIAATALAQPRDLAADPHDATGEGWLAFCLFAKSRHGATAAEQPALIERARQAARRARQLGKPWPLLLALQKDGLVEPWILLNAGPDPEIAQNPAQ